MHASAETLCESRLVESCQTTSEGAQVRPSECLLQMNIAGVPSSDPCSPQCVLGVAAECMARPRRVPQLTASVLALGVWRAQLPPVHAHGSRQARPVRRGTRVALQMARAGSTATVATRASTLHGPVRCYMRYVQRGCTRKLVEFCGSSSHNTVASSPPKIAM